MLAVEHLSGFLNLFIENDFYEWNWSWSDLDETFAFELYDLYYYELSCTELHRVIGIIILNNSNQRN